MLISNTENKSRLLLAMGLLLNGFLVILVLIVTILKESYQFWSNDGGYPVWLRQAVLTFYYPAILSTGALLCFLTFYGADLFRKSRKGLRLLGPCILVWCIYGLAWGLCVADNLEELFVK